MYALFGWYEYYPQGGFKDFICKFDSRFDLLLLLDNSEYGYDTYQIVNIESFEPIFLFSDVENLQEFYF